MKIVLIIKIWLQTKIENRNYSNLTDRHNVYMLSEVWIHSIIIYRIFSFHTMYLMNVLWVVWLQNFQVSVQQACVEPIFMVEHLL